MTYCNICGQSTNQIADATGLMRCSACTAAAATEIKSSFPRTSPHSSIPTILRGASVVTTVGAILMIYAGFDTMPQFGAYFVAAAVQAVVLAVVLWALADIHESVRR